MTMPTRAGIRMAACRVRVLGQNDDLVFEWELGSVHKAAIRDAVTHALRDANPDDYPDIARMRSGFMHLRIAGSRFGTDDLGLLLPLIEQAAAAAGKVIRARIGALDIRVAWSTDGVLPLDNLLTDTSDSSAKEVPLTTDEPDSPDIMSRLNQLCERLIPKVSDADIAELEGILRAAQSRSPVDHEAFIKQVNELLDVCSLRIHTGPEDQGRLSANPDGSLKITRASGGTRGFKNATISLAAVERTRVGNRFTGKQPDSPNK